MPIVPYHGTFGTRKHNEFAVGWDITQIRGCVGNPCRIGHAQRVGLWQVFLSWNSVTLEYRLRAYYANLDREQMQAHELHPQMNSIRMFPTWRCLHHPTDYAHERVTGQACSASMGGPHQMAAEARRWVSAIRLNAISSPWANTAAPPPGVAPRWPRSPPGRPPSAPASARGGAPAFNPHGRIAAPN